MNTDTDRPDEQWSLARLGSFCSKAQKKLAIHAWRFGHALNLARSKQPHGDWQAWKNKYVPGLGHSSEHRYRTLARSLTEDSLEGMGLTEAYRLLELTGMPEKGKGNGRGDPFVQAPQAAVSGGGCPLPSRAGAVATGADEPDEDGPDADDDLAELPPPARFRDLPPATGLMGNDEDGHSRIATALMEVEPGVAVFATEHAGEESPGERYRTLLREAVTHLDALRCWADWLKQRDEVFLVEMWDKHGVDGVAALIDRTVESLRWVAGNLEW
ncbi:MAG: hypothetical protein K2V38_09340 [Gemmataceae bacterium]|nr:hypothetical protein [Gemmataceae bacterium]